MKLLSALLFIFLCSKCLGFLSRSKILTFRSETLVKLDSKVPAKPSEETPIAKDLEQKWQSGAVFRKNNGRGRNNDPWWMSEDENNNPRILAKYTPWWATKNVLVNNSWKLVDLRKEAARRNMPQTGKKQELIDQLRRSSMTFTLSDEGFISPKYSDEISDAFPKCYPEAYEEIAMIQRLSGQSTVKSAP